MKRRHLLSSVGLGIPVAVGGCLDRGESTASGNGDGPDDPNDVTFPDHPETLDSPAVREYVAEYEGARLQQRLNEQYRNTSSSGSGSCEVDAAIVTFDTADALYVSVANCRFSVSSDGPNGAGMGTSEPALYRVTETDYARIEPERKSFDDPYLTTDEGGNTGHGIWLCNFEESSREVSVALTHRGDDPVTVLERTFDLEPDQGAHLTDVADVPGEYTVDVETAAGATATEPLELTGERSSRQPMAAVLAVPDGELVVGDVEYAR